MPTLIYLFAGHALCDYPWQGDFLAQGKNRHTNPGSGWIKAMFAHCCIHAGMVMAITGSSGMAIGEFVIHFATDCGKMRGLDWFGYRSGDPLWLQDSMGGASVSWEIEYEHVDKVEGVHRYMLIERSTVGRDGQPARYEYVIRLGIGHDGESCPHCQQPVERDITLSNEGHLMHAVHGPVSPHDLVRTKLDELNGFHSRMEAYAKRHKVTMYNGRK